MGKIDFRRYYYIRKRKRLIKLKYCKGFWPTEQHRVCGRSRSSEETDETKQVPKFRKAPGKCDKILLVSRDKDFHHKTPEEARKYLLRHIAELRETVLNKEHKKKLLLAKQAKKKLLLAKKQDKKSGSTKSNDIKSLTGPKKLVNKSEHGVAKR